MSVRSALGPDRHEIAWHEAECGAYTADLALWSELAGERRGPVLDLGAGSGRVAARLAEAGHEVLAVDLSPALLAATAERCAGLPGTVRTVECDVRELDPIDERFELAIAPMQLVHLLGGAAGRQRFLAAVASRLVPGGLLVLAILDDRELVSDGTPAPWPDVREVDGWIHSSLPLAVRVEDERIDVVRLRQLVSPEGELSDERHVIVLDRIDSGDLEAEAGAAGLRPAGRRRIDATDDHVGSVAILLEAPR